MSNKQIKLNNLTCVYCGAADMDIGTFDYDHVIGRNFVPTGSFSSGWSLKVRACKLCNGIKSKLEDDISAITLLRALSHNPADEELRKLVLNKASKSHSKRTKKPVANSDEKLSIGGTLMGRASISFNMVGPPQVDTARLHELALMHLKAFLYLITYREAERKGGYSPRQVVVAADGFQSDWGNPPIVAFAALTGGWKEMLHGIGAKGYFKIVLRADPENEDILAFALEWNRSYRVVGFIGPEQQLQHYVSRLPDKKWKRLDATTRYYQETPLDPANDILFAGGDDVGENSKS